jgi:hypothetical protein
MEKVKNIKPVYLYIIAGILSIASSSVERNTTIYYIFLVSALVFFIWAIAKYFSKSN